LTTTLSAPSLFSPSFPFPSLTFSPHSLAPISLPNRQPISTLSLPSLARHLTFVFYGPLSLTQTTLRTIVCPLYPTPSPPLFLPESTQQFYRSTLPYRARSVPD
jgi:hypothetical protein